MDKTYSHIYEELYRHLYKFCIAGSVPSKEAIKNMATKVEVAKDLYLENLYDIVVNAVDVDDVKGRFLQKVKQYSLSLKHKDYENKWCLYLFLLPIYKYIYPDSERIRECQFQIDNAVKELSKTPGWRSLFEFDDADYAIQMHIDKTNTMYSAYQAEFNSRDFRLNNRSFMMILKGYSSSTPFFYSALKERFHNVSIKGGGIFLKWRGTGIAVDPGINFMENMHIAGLGIRDIDVVIVTHNHIDHNGDLVTIDDLASQFDKKDISFFTDKRTEQKFSGRLAYFPEENMHSIDITMSSGFDLGNNKDVHVDVIETKHMMDAKNEFSRNTSFAVKISLKECDQVKAKIGFTSDTIYLEELSDAFKDCDYVIANISETSQNDYSKRIPKENHLGYGGCLDLIQQCNLKRASDNVEPFLNEGLHYIISEFWAGKGDVRRELIKSLRNESSYNYIYPGDIGMMFFLDQQTFMCGYCRCERELKDLHVIRPEVEYSPFSNICEECILL